MDTGDHGNSIYIEHQVRGSSFAMTYEHFHTYCEIFYLKTGNCIYSVENRIYHLTAGDVFIVAPGDPHSTSYEGLVPCERYVVCCPLEALPLRYWEEHNDIREKLAQSGKVILVKNGKQQMEMLLEAMLEENNVPDEYSDEFLLLQMQVLLLTIMRNGIFLYEQIQHDNGVSKDIEGAMQYIARNFAMPLTLQEVAESINLSPTYLSKKFRKETGTTFKEYVNYIRIHQASKMLLTTDDSITKIALNCGFNSSNYFKDCFHRANGVSPRAFRRQAQTHSDIEQ